MYMKPIVLSKLVVTIKTNLDLYQNVYYCVSDGFEPPLLFRNYDILVKPDMFHLAWNIILSHFDISTKFEHLLNL